MNDAPRVPCNLLARAVAALCLVGLYGTVGVCIDLDHFVRPLQLVLDGQTPTFADVAGRPLHWLVFVLAGLICGCGFSYCLGRLIVRWIYG